MKAIFNNGGCLESLIIEDDKGKEIAAKEAENGEYSIVDLTEEEAVKLGFITLENPTQLDKIEAQVTYTAMMTDALLEA